MKYVTLVKFKKSHEWGHKRCDDLKKTLS